MINSVSNRTVSLAALAAAAGLIWSTAPAWACAPTGAGSSSGGSDNHQGPDSSGYNGAAAEGARQGAAAASTGLDNSGEPGPARSSPDTAQEHSGQIAAIQTEEAPDIAENCARLKLELVNAQIQHGLNVSHSMDHPETNLGQGLYDAAVKMTPDQLDSAIAVLRAGAADPHDVRLSFLMDLRASQMFGLGEEDLKRRAQQQLAAAAQALAQQQAPLETQIRDLQSQIADLDCANAVPHTVSQFVPPNTSPAPEP
jgi:hypothetical protein